MRAHGTHPTRESKPAARRSVQLNHPHLAGLTIKEKCKQTARKPNKGRLKKVSYQFEKIIYKRAACRSDSRIRHLFAEQGTHIALAVGQTSDSRIRPTRMMPPNCFYFVRLFFRIGIRRPFNISMKNALFQNKALGERTMFDFNFMITLVAENHCCQCLAHHHRVSAKFPCRAAYRKTVYCKKDVYLVCAASGVRLPRPAV